eukprot:scpid46055/ scgid1422/ 
MGRYTSTVALIIFLVAQFIQGIILNNFLRRETGNTDQWLWLIGDLALLLFWTLMIVKRGTTLVQLDMPFLPVPTMAATWGIYMAVVFIPRVAWLMTAAGTCLGQSQERNLQAENSTTVLEQQLSFGLLTAIGWGANTLITTLAVGSTAMFLFLVMSGYGQHGLLKSSNAPLDFDMAEAAFCMMDGVEFLGAFFEVGDVGQCGNTLQVCTLCNTTADHEETVYIDAIEGSFGAFIITLTVACFTLPFFALWQFKRRSAVLKANNVIKQDARKLSRLHSSAGTTSLQASFSSSEPMMKKTSGSSSIDGENGSEDDAYDPNQTLSAHYIDLLSYKHDMETMNCMERELSILKITYIFWDMLVINLTGAIVRLVLWFKFNRPISALITKNILAVIFRSLNLFNDYFLPWYQTRYPRIPDAEEDTDDAGGSKSNSLLRFSRVQSFKKLGLKRSTTSASTSTVASPGLRPISETDSEERDIPAESHSYALSAALPSTILSKPSQKSEICIENPTHESFDSVDQEDSSRVDLDDDNSPMAEHEESRAAQEVSKTARPEHTQSVDNELCDSPAHGGGENHEDEDGSHAKVKTPDEGTIIILSPGHSSEEHEC